MDERGGSQGALAVIGTRSCKYGRNCIFEDCQNDHPHGWNPQAAKRKRGRQGKGKGKGKGGSHWPNKKKNRDRAWVRCPVYGLDCTITKKNGSCHHKKRQQANAAVAELKEAEQKLKNVQKSNADLVAKQTRVRAAMAASGLTSKEQQFGMVAICQVVQDMSLSETASEPQTAASAASTPRTVTFRFDTGATHHFSSTDVKLDNVQPDHTTVSTASEGHNIQLTQQGVFTSEVPEEEVAMEFDVKQGKEFALNLFSGFRAVKDGCRVVLDEDYSFIEHKGSGTKFPLKMTSAGWDLELRNGSNAAKHAYGAVSNEQ
jgi:hypothetical protein